MRNWHGRLSPFGRWHTAGTSLAAQVAALFGPSDVGWFYDNSDFSTMFQDSAGTTPVTAVGQSVGLQLDKSQGLVLGPELVTNGTFDTDVSGWTGLGGTPILTWNAGVLRIENGSAAASRATFTFNSVAGRFYKIAVQEVGGTGNGGWNINIGLRVNGGPRIVQATGSTTTIDLYVGSSTAGHFYEYDNVSVRELPGNHRFQSTSLNRPILARHPVGGRRNLLVASEAFGDAAWLKSGGAWSGGEFTPVSGSGVSFNTRGILSNESITSAAVQVSGFFDVAASDLRYICYGISNGAGGFTATVVVDTQTWTVAANGTHPSYTSGISGSVEAIPGGHRLHWTATKLENSPSTPLICPSSTYGGTYNRSVTTDGVGGITLLRAQGGLGATTGAYQKVTTAFDVTEAGVPDLYYLSYDGVNDSLATSAFDWGTDKATVVAGVQKLSDAARGTIVERTASIAANNGAFHMTAPNAASDTFAFESKGTTLTDAVATGVAAPATRVLTGIGDISGDSAIIRANGAVIDTDASDQGTGDYTSAATYFGARAGTSNYFNGREYSQFAINRLLTESELALVERYTNSRTGAY